MRLEGLKGDGEGVWECERKGCEIVKGRERKLEGEIERGMNCTGRHRRGEG